jgi:hypothetical protein
MRNFPRTGLPQAGRGKKQAAPAFAFLSLDTRQMQEAQHAKRSLRLVSFFPGQACARGGGERAAFAEPPSMNSDNSLPRRLHLSPRGATSPPDMIRTSKSLN